MAGRVRAGDDLVATPADPVPASRRELRRRLQRHGESPTPALSRATSALTALSHGGAEVSAYAFDLHTGAELIALDERLVLPTASLGKVLLLIEVSARIGSGKLDPASALRYQSGDRVADSGIWQYLRVPALPIADLAALVGTVSDNLATNVLLGAVGVDAVRARAESLGLVRTALLDRVRDRRGPEHAPQLSVGSAAELARLFAALVQGEVVDRATSDRVVDWLAMNTDHSMVAAGFGLDPLAHQRPDHDTLLINKTGTDAGVRAEAGALRGSRAGVSYAVAVRFDDRDLPTRLRVLEAMRTVGTELLEHVHLSR